MTFEDLWIAGDPDGRVDGSPRHFDRYDFSNIEYPGINLNNVEMRDGKLCGSEINEAQIECSNFSRTDFSNSNLENASIYFSNFEGANFQNCKLNKANLYEVNLRGANLENLDFSEGNPHFWVPMSGLLILDSMFSKLAIHRGPTDMTQVNASGSNMREAKLGPPRNAPEWDRQHVIARSATFDESDLSGAWVICGDFEGASFRNAILRNTQFQGACLRNADLTGADLTGADLTGATMPDGTIHS
jgi:uncharacterized protein YjbI with pentapeptide repeats